MNGGALSEHRRDRGGRFLPIGGIGETRLVPFAFLFTVVVDRWAVSGHEFLLLVVGLFWLSVAFTVAIDATRRGRQGGVWGITTFLLGPIGLVLYALAVLGAIAGSESDRSEEDHGSRYRACPVCGAGHDGIPDRCSACGEPLGPGDEPPSARLLRSGSRGYCGNCKARVGLDSERCPNCGSVF